MKPKGGKMIKWLGSNPKNCDVCGEPFDNKDFYDAKTRLGPWGMLCVACFRKHGVGLGTGMGQRYMYDPFKKEWIKKAG